MNEQTRPGVVRVLRLTLATVLTAVPRWCLRQHYPVAYNGRIICSPGLHHGAVDYPCQQGLELRESVTALWERTAHTECPDYLP
jgi:hypothetical protein